MDFIQKKEEEIQTAIDFLKLQLENDPQARQKDLDKLEFQRIKMKDAMYKDIIEVYSEKYSQLKALVMRYQFSLPSTIHSGLVGYNDVISNKDKGT